MTEAEEYLEWRIRFKYVCGTWPRPQEAWIAAKESSRKQIEELQAFEDECANLNAELKDYQETLEKNAQLTKQIEELQSRIAMQDEALQKLARLGNGDSYGNSIGNCIAIDAISADVAAWQEERDEEIAAKATVKALEKAIQACRDEENKAWALKGTRDWSSYIEGMSDGAGECADRIVELRNRTGEPK